jgi:hypothetical protein
MRRKMKLPTYCTEIKMPIWKMVRLLERVGKLIIYFHATHEVINMKTLAFKVNAGIVILERTIVRTTTLISLDILKLALSQRNEFHCPLYETM